MTARIKIMKTRKEIRLKNYDYSKEGIYYVTICSYQRKNTFCKIDDRIFDIEFNDTDFDKYIEYTIIGRHIDKGIQNINELYTNVSVLNYIIMPNHIHILIEFDDKPLNKKGKQVNLFKIISSFKQFVTKTVNSDTTNIWQKSYYEHIVRNEKEFDIINEYIIYNPLKWKLDEYYNM